MCIRDRPLTFAALLVGANLPYWFSAMTMKSVGLAAAEMVQEVERQFKADPSLLDPNSTSTPDYDACVEISTKASLREMIAPAALVMLTPLVAGTFFGVEAVFGILTGGLVSGVQLAISMSNSGGAWDNAKKYISGGFDPDPALRKKDANGNSTPVHDAAVTGDTVGDPFKDTSGPALNILIKLMSMVSLTVAPLLKAYHKNWDHYHWGFIPFALFVIAFVLRFALTSRRFAYVDTFIKSVFNHAKDILNHIEATADESLEAGRVNGGRGCWHRRWSWCKRGCDVGYALLAIDSRSCWSG